MPKKRNVQGKQTNYSKENFRLRDMSEQKSGSLRKWTGGQRTN